MLEKTESNKYLVALICILAVPALLINLEIMPTLGDEATRALVALEFILRKNYIFLPLMVNLIIINLLFTTGYWCYYLIHLAALMNGY